MIRRLLLIGLLAAGVRTAHSASPEPEVAVLLFAGSRVESVEFESADEVGLTIFEDGELIAILEPHERVVVEQWQGVLRVRWSRGSAPVERCTLSGPERTRVEANGQPGGLYRGSFGATLDETDSGLRITNTVDVEDYVASVLPAEYPFTELEGAKAQAIVIRSYAVAASGNTDSGTTLRDDIGSQVYRGVSAETEFSRRVARMTAGSTLLFEGEPVEAVYSAHCGGHTADNEDIWGTTPVPYLRGRRDPYDHDAPVAEWSTYADVELVHRRLSGRLQKPVEGIRIEDRGAGRHVRAVKVEVEGGRDEIIRGEHFRTLLNNALGESIIRSSIFEIKKRSGDYRFEGRGSGHGVGFCQWGAAAQAREGRSYDEILRFYYRDVDIADGPPAAVAAAESSYSPAKPNVRKRRPGW